MVKLLLGLDQPPTPHDVADALAVALCHLQSSTELSRPRFARMPSSRNPRSGPGASIVRDRTTTRFVD